MKWAEVSIRTSHEETELIAEIFHDVGASGVVIEDPEEFNSYIDSGLFDYSNLPKAEQTNIVTIKAYLPVDEELDDRLRTFEQRVRDLAKVDGFDAGSCPIEWHTVQDEDWADNWKAYFKPFRLYDNIIIKPTWEEVPEDATDEDIVIEIDPGTAFGTGSHETTRLCIGQLKKYMKDGDEILDAGSGSGILSFVCNKLGAKHVLGIDIDPIAVDVAGENRDVNHIPAEAVEFKCGNVLEDQKLVESIGANYDIVVANILADVIIPMSAVVQKFMKDDGIFISSGIINIKEDEVRQALLDNNFDIVDTVYMNDWVSFVAKKHV